MLFLIIGTLAGVLLGLRFKVSVLVPFILILACAIVATGDGWRAIALTVLATAVLVQIGYLLGRVGSVCAAPALFPRRRPGRAFSRRIDRRYGPIRATGPTKKPTIRSMPTGVESGRVMDGAWSRWCSPASAAIRLGASLSA
jgi:hypothetical protein